MNMRKILSTGLLLVSIGGIAVSAVNLIPYLREEAQSASLYAEPAAIYRRAAFHGGRVFP